MGRRNRKAALSAGVDDPAPPRRRGLLGEPEEERVKIPGAIAGFDDDILFVNFFFFFLEQNIILK